MTLVFTSIAPLAHVAYLFSVSAMFSFIGQYFIVLINAFGIPNFVCFRPAPVLLSLVAYGAGLVFYATHFPECVFSRPGHGHWLDYCGGGSHAIWHVCIVLGILLHKRALDQLQGGIQ